MDTKLFSILIVIISFLVAGCLGDDSGTDKESKKGYPLHENINVTVFWIGEEGNVGNGFIPNTESSWDNSWVEHFGGVDDPDNRDGYYPSGFTPLENPFYFALPYNDFDNEGNRKVNADNVVYWADSQDWDDTESMCKNRWIKIVKNGRMAYAQWEDVGPFWDDDYDYVFGINKPKTDSEGVAGLDVSPAVRDYLKLSDFDTVSWQFVDAELVPGGPWREIVTESGVYWE
jgi:hypothetical protein